MTIVSSSVSEPTATSAEKLIIDFLFLDLATCTRCRGTDRSLEAGLAAVGDVLAAAGMKVEVRKVHIRSAGRGSGVAVRVVSDRPDQRRRHRRRAAGELVRLRGLRQRLRRPHRLSRLGVRRARIHRPPRELIVDAVLRQMYGQLTDAVENQPYRAAG